jgi:hypothetical protein
MEAAASPMTSPDTDSDADPEITQTVATLVGAGFVKVSDDLTGSFDDRIVELVRGNVRIQIVRDRGRHLLTVYTPIDGIYRGYGEWLSCARHEKPDLVVGSLSDEVRSLVQHLPKLEALLLTVDPAALRDCLRAANRWRREQANRQRTKPRSDR